jgi:glucokinase
MYYLGIEIGGTKLQLGVGADDGKLAARWRGPVDVAAGPEGIRQQIVGAVPELLAKAGLERGQLEGVGIGFGGPVDDATRTVIKSHQIEGWDGFPLADWVSDVVGLPAALGNDADVAGLAEAVHGAGKGLSPIFYITIGSGIGGGLIIDGEIYRGVGRGAAEIGHVHVTPKFWYLPPEGYTTYSPAIEPAQAGQAFALYGQLSIPLEDVASGWSISRLARTALAVGMDPESTLARRFERSLDRMTALDIAEAAAEGDEFASSLMEQARTCLADAISRMITLLCPRRIVLGGGVALMGEKLLIEPLRRLVAERVFEPFAGLTDIVSAALGEEVVVHGAIALVRRRLGRRET